MPAKTETTRPTAAHRPAVRRRDAVGCAVEIGQIATGQKADPHPIPPEESILRRLFEEENERQNSK